MKKILLILLLIPTLCFSQKRSTGGGTGTTVPVYGTSPTLTTPNLGTPSTLVGTNITGTASGFTAGNVTTNANLTGDVTSSGNATTIGSLKVTSGMIAANAATLGKLDASNATANKVLMSGASASPTWSTPTYPNTSPTSRKILVSDGTNIVASTETWAVPGATAGTHLVGDGTNWTAVNERTNWTSFVVSGSAATTTGQTLVDVTGLTSGTLSATTKYEVEAWLDVSTSAVTTGTQYAIFANGTGTAAVYNAYIVGTTTTNATTSATQSSATQQGTFLTTSGTAGIIYIHGFITTRSTGTITISIQHLKVTSGTSTVAVGSLMRIRLAN